MRELHQATELYLVSACQVEALVMELYLVLACQVEASALELHQVMEQHPVSACQVEALVTVLHQALVMELYLVSACQVEALVTVLHQTERLVLEAPRRCQQHHRLLCRLMVTGTVQCQLQRLAWELQWQWGHQGGVHQATVTDPTVSHQLTTAVSHQRRMPPSL